MTPARPIVLYRHALSGHCHRVELLLRMLRLPFETREVDLAAGAQRDPAFLAVNPFGQVPVIDDDGVVLADSNAILVYLALRYAPPSWLPRDPLGAARVQRWLSLAAGPLAHGPATARAVRLFARRQDPAPAMAAAHALFSTIEGMLDGQGFLAGAQPTIADLAMFSYTAHAPDGGVELDAYPRLRGWLARVRGLAGFVDMPQGVEAGAGRS